MSVASIRAAILSGWLTDSGSQISGGVLPLDENGQLANLAHAIAVQVQAAIDGGGGGGSSRHGYDIESTEHDDFTDEGMSADWDGGSISPWSAGGATISGTVTMLAVPGTPIYDATTHDGLLYLQPTEGATVGTHDACLVINSIIGDGEQITFSLCTPGASGATANNEMQYGVCLNTSGTNWQTGSFDMFYFDGPDEQWDHWNGGLVADSEIAAPAGHASYIRLIRSGSRIYAFVSHDGETWLPLSSVDTVARGHTHTWLWYRVSGLAGLGGGAKIVAPMIVRWIRHNAYTGLRPF